MSKVMKMPWNNNRHEHNLVLLSLLIHIGLESRTKFESVESVSRSVVSNPLWPHRLQPAWPLCPWNSSGKNTGVGSHSLLQGIFPTQGSNPHLPHFKADSLLSEPPGNYVYPHYKYINGLEGPPFLGSGKDQHHHLNGHVFEQTLGDSEGQGSLVFMGSQSQTQLSNDDKGISCRI